MRWDCGDPKTFECQSHHKHSRQSHFYLMFEIESSHFGAGQIISQDLSATKPFAIQRVVAFRPDLHSPLARLSHGACAAGHPGHAALPRTPFDGLFHHPATWLLTHLTKRKTPEVVVKTLKRTLEAVGFLRSMVSLSWALILLLIIMWASKKNRTTMTWTGNLNSRSWQVSFCHHLYARGHLVQISGTERIHVFAKS